MKRERTRHFNVFWKRIGHISQFLRRPCLGERHLGKTEYSCVGGCYYSCKFGVLEALAREKKQAGAIILREAYQGYVPLGVFNVRENVRSAMAQPWKGFETLTDALKHVSPKLRLPLSAFVRESTLLKEQLRGRQTTLKERF